MAEIEAVGPHGTQTSELQPLGPQTFLGDELGRGIPVSCVAGA